MLRAAGGQLQAYEGGTMAESGGDEGTGADAPPTTAAPVIAVLDPPSPPDEPSA